MLTDNMILRLKTLAALSWLLLPSLALAAEPPPERVRELVRMVRQDCGSCHGLTLQGGLGPALTAAALRGREARMLSATIFYGRAGTPMPPFRGILTEEETRWIAAQLLSGFPQEPRP